MRGIYPMLYAFFDEGGALRRDAFAPQVEAAIANGADGVAVLGLGTEGPQLTAAERGQVVDWVAESLNGRIPLAVTVSGATIDEQADFARYARRCGAAWLILQPPPRQMPDSELRAFFGRVADRLDCAVAVQNAPQFLGYGLSISDLLALHVAHPNICAVKAETSAVEMRDLVQSFDGRLAAFNGRAGLELTDNLRAGVAGMIPGVETLDLQVRCAKLMAQGREEEAESIYRCVLPAVTFIMQGVAHFVTYGKYLASLRLGLEGGMRNRTGLSVKSFGEEIAARFARDLGALSVSV